MKVRWKSSHQLTSLLLLIALPAGVWAADILQTDGFSTCGTDDDIKVERMNIEYNKATNKVIFDVAGTSEKEQMVMAALTVTAYGKQVYQKTFNPCDSASKVVQLCPIPKGSFAAQGSQDIPKNYADMIPGIAFSVPDLDGVAKLQLQPIGGGPDIACIQSAVGNGKTVSVAAAPVIAAGIAGAALVVSSLSSLASAGSVGGAAPSPTFPEVMGWFQSMALNGMLSVNYPTVYRSFSKNFGFSGGLIPWASMQTSIDSFRKATGGNLTQDSYQYLRNATLVYQANNATLTKRSLDEWRLYVRDVALTANGTAANNTSAGDYKTMHFVHGIQGYVEQLTIPQSNTFMTVLLIFAIVVAAIIVGILLFKVILEIWALFGTFPERLAGFRERYWWTMAKTITNLILLLYGVWTLYCVYQFTQGDSWAAKALAGVTLGLFTVILVFFSWRVWSLARKYKKAEGDVSGLYENKATWVKYSIFYDSFKKGYWWMFVPAIIYMFTKGVVIAAGDGHGFFQTAGQLIVESIMLILLLWTRPYSLKSGNWINIVIQVVRVLSVLCILVFVEKLGISQTTKTITGVVLIVMQSVLTGVLAILIAVNALIVMFKMNPHRKARKDAEKLNRDMDDLTPLDARNSLLLAPPEYKGLVRAPMVDAHPSSPPRKNYLDDYYQNDPSNYQQSHRAMDSRDSLFGDHMSTRTTTRNPSPNLSMRAPLLPDVDMSYRSKGY